ncbi:hypothetical protein JMUB5695_04429 [Mycobacterium heckeshornense]|nr:hypothetical protein JMUB5695_04429 [Mycobacterium heckeshornense]
MLKIISNMTVAAPVPEKEVSGGDWQEQPTIVQRMAAARRRAKPYISTLSLCNANFTEVR